MKSATRTDRPVVVIDLPEESPGSPERDHRIPPARLDPGESTLPEGAQPPRDLARRSALLVAALIVVGMAAIVTVGLVLFGPSSLPVSAVLIVVMGFFGLWPVVGAARLRRGDREQLNEDDAERRAP